LNINVNIAEEICR